MSAANPYRFELIIGIIVFIVIVFVIGFWNIEVSNFSGLTGSFHSFGGSCATFNIPPDGGSTCCGIKCCNTGSLKDISGSGSGSGS
jgi:hypothetical protein